MKLTDIAEVLPGYPFRGAIVPDSDGAVAIVQVKDLTQGEPLTDTSSLVQTAHNLSSYDTRLRKGDVLIAARGMKSSPFRASVFDAEDKEVVTSSSVHIIRTTSPKVMPEYLALFLNSHGGQLMLAGMVTGSYIGTLPRRELGHLKIPAISIEKQQALVALSNTIRQQQELLDRSKEIRQNILNAVTRTVC